MATKTGTGRLREPGHLLADRIHDELLCLLSLWATSDSIPLKVDQCRAASKAIAAALQEWLGPAWAGMPTEECLGTMTTEEQLADAMGTLVKDHETAVNLERKATPWEWIQEKAAQEKLATPTNLDPGMQKELANMLATRTDPILNWLVQQLHLYDKHYDEQYRQPERDLLRQLKNLRGKQLVESRDAWDRVEGLRDAFVPGEIQ